MSVCVSLLLPLLPVFRFLNPFLSLLAGLVRVSSVRCDPFVSFSANSVQQLGRKYRDRLPTHIKSNRPYINIHVVVTPHRQQEQAIHMASRHTYRSSRVVRLPLSIDPHS